MLAPIRNTIASDSTSPFGTAPIRQASRDLTQALKSGDLSAARQAYASLVKAMPEGATVKPGTPFAQLGRALVEGDMNAARTAYADIFKSRQATPPSLPPEPAPVPSTTGGAAGSLVNTVA